MKHLPLLLSLMGSLHTSGPYSGGSYEVPEGRGTENALDRKRREAARLAEVYAATPAPTETRQQRRARERAERKQA